MANKHNADNSHVRESKTVLDSGFSPMDFGFQVLDFGFSFSGTWILLNSKAQDSEFHEQ